MARAKHAAPTTAASTSAPVRPAVGGSNARRAATQATPASSSTGSFASVWSDLGGALERGWDATTEAARAGGAALKDAASSAYTKADQALTLAPALWGDLDLADAAAMDPALANALTFDATEAKANKLDYDFIGADTVRIDALRLASARLFGLTTGAIAADGIRLTEQRATASKQSATLQLPAAEAADIAQLDPALRAAGVIVTDVEVQRTFQRDGFWAEGFFAAPGPTAITVGGVEIAGLEGALSGDLTATGLAAQAGEGRVDAQVATLTGTGLSAGDLTADALSATGVAVQQRGDQIAATASTLGATGLATADVTLAAASASGVHATTGPSGTQAGADTLTLAGLQAGDARLGSLTARDVSGASTQAGLSGSASSLSAEHLSAGGATVAAADLLDLQVHDGHASASSLTATGIGVAVPGLEARASSASATGLSASADGSAAASNLDVSELAATTWARATPSVDPRLVNQLIALVEDVSARGTIELGGSTGSGMSSLSFRPGTRALVELRVLGGRLVPGGTRVTLDKPGDAFAWTALKGVYVTRDGRVLADVAGWFDQDVGRQLQLPDGRLPLPLNSLAALATSPAKASNKASTDFTKVVGDTQGQASLTLGSGTVTTDAASATLAAGNRATVTQSQSGGASKLGVSFTRLVLTSLGLRQTGGSVQLGGVAVSNAQASTVTKQGTTVTDLRASRLTAGSVSGTR